MSNPSESKGELRSESNMRRFELHREEDDTGVSGTGIVAEGVEFSNGKVSMTWYSHMGSIVNMDSMKVLHATSIHKGATKIHWLDDAPFETEKGQEPEEPADG